VEVQVLWGVSERMELFLLRFFAAAGDSVHQPRLALTGGGKETTRRHAMRPERGPCEMRTPAQGIVAISVE